MLARAFSSLPRVLALVSLTVLGVSTSGGCHAVEPTNRPVDTCIRSCEARASRACTDAECTRGCEFILDRLVERETENVIACVAKTPRRCGDVVWADCAAHIGAHFDGGPPAPPPPQEED